jgi:hypothetical protein
MKRSWPGLLDIVRQIVYEGLTSPAEAECV